MKAKNNLSYNPNMSSCTVLKSLRRPIITYCLKKNWTPRMDCYYPQCIREYNSLSSSTNRGLAPLLNYPTITLLNYPMINTYQNYHKLSNYNHYMVTIFLRYHELVHHRTATSRMPLHRSPGWLDMTGRLDFLIQNSMVIFSGDFTLTIGWYNEI